MLDKILYVVRTYIHTYVNIDVGLHTYIYKVYALLCMHIIIRDDTKKWELLKNPTKIEEIQKKNLLTEIETLHLAF